MPSIYAEIAQVVERRTENPGVPSASLGLGTIKIIVKDIAPYKSMNMPANDEPLIALSSLSLGQKALIVAFSFDTEEGERIEQKGFLPGEQVEVVRLPPQGDSIEIKIRGYFLSLRKQEADRIKVKLFS